MKLIDLDEIENFILVDKFGVPRFKIEIGDGLPIIEAIPINWIEKNYAIYGFIKELIEKWREENEH